MIYYYHESFKYFWFNQQIRCLSIIIYKIFFILYVIATPDLVSTPSLRQAGRGRSVSAPCGGSGSHGCRLPCDGSHHRRMRLRRLPPRPQNRWHILQQAWSDTRYWNDETCWPFLWTHQSRVFRPTLLSISRYEFRNLWIVYRLPLQGGPLVFIQPRKKSKWSGIVAVLRLPICQRHRIPFSLSYVVYTDLHQEEYVKQLYALVQPSFEETMSKRIFIWHGFD